MTPLSAAAATNRPASRENRVTARAPAAGSARPDVTRRSASPTSPPNQAAPVMPCTRSLETISHVGGIERVCPTTGSDASAISPPTATVKRPSGEGQRERQPGHHKSTSEPRQAM